MSTDIRPAPDARFQAPRWHDLDAVRALALLSGVALHGVMSFMSPRVWIVADTHTSTGADVLFYVIHLFRMTLFFVLAGFFARLMMQKKGVAGFVGNRLKRIAVPLVVFWPLILASIIVMMIVANPPVPGALPAPPPPALSVATFPLTHLWFLYMLLILYAGAVVIKVVTDLLHVGGGLGRMFDGAVAALTRCELITLLLAAPIAIAFYCDKAWMMWFGIPTPDIGLVPNAVALSGFVTAFVFGWWLNRRADLLDHLARRVWSYGLTTAAGVWACLALAGQAPVLTPVDGHDHALYAVLYALTSWSGVFFLIGLARRTLQKENPVIRRLSDASYWIYLIHVPVLLVAQWLVIKLDLPPIAKFFMVLAGTMVVGLLSYPLMIRYSFIGTILNGRRQTARRAALSTEATA